MKRRQYLGGLAGIGAATALPTVSAATSTSSHIGTISDPEGDDSGPGSYTYPTTSQIADGVFDVTQLDIADGDDTWDFTIHTRGPINNPWSAEDGFSVHAFQMYLQDPNAPDDATASTTPREGLNSAFQDGYHYRVAVHGEGLTVVEAPAEGDGDPETLVEDFDASADPDNRTISFSLPKSPFDSDDFTQMKAAILMAGHDGFGPGGIRANFSEEAGEWAFGGVNPDALDSAPRIIDLVAPESLLKQSEVLSYSADSAPSIPLTKVEYLISGEVPDTGGVPEALADPGPTVWAGLEGSLNGGNSSDPDEQDLTYQWEQIDGPSANLSGTDTAEPTFAAPDVDEEATLTFQLTVTDTDGNTATDTTTATVKPQSANDAPIANAGEDRTVAPGDLVSLQAAGSEDPNGGTLTYQWEQTGGPEVELDGADSFGAAFTVPEVDEEATMTFELTVDDGQGKTASDTVNVTAEPEQMMTTTESMGDDTTTTESMGDDTTTTTEMDEQTLPGPDDTTETTTEDGGDSSGGFGPGFGVVSGAVGAAGGIAYAAKRRLGGDVADDEE